jgi:hypothetical protein
LVVSVYGSASARDISVSRPGCIFTPSTQLKMNKIHTGVIKHSSWFSNSCGKAGSFRVVVADRGGYRVSGEAKVHPLNNSQSANMSLSALFFPYRLVF